MDGEVVRARGDVGTHWQMQPGVGSGEGGGVVWAVRARGGVGTQWQPLNTL